MVKSHTLQPMNPILLLKAKNKTKMTDDVNHSLKKINTASVILFLSSSCMLVFSNLNVFVIGSFIITLCELAAITCYTSEITSALHEPQPTTLPTTASAPPIPMRTIVIDMEDGRRVN